MSTKKNILFVDPLTFNKLINFEKQNPNAFKLNLGIYHEIVEINEPLEEFDFDSEYGLQTYENNSVSGLKIREKLKPYLQNPNYEFSFAGDLFTNNNQNLKLAKSLKDLVEKNAKKLNIFNVFKNSSRQQAYQAFQRPENVDWQHFDFAVKIDAAKKQLEENRESNFKTIKQIVTQKENLDQKAQGKDKIHNLSDGLTQQEADDLTLTDMQILEKLYEREQVIKNQNPFKGFCIMMNFEGFEVTPFISDKKQTYHKEINTNINDYEDKQEIVDELNRFLQSRRYIHIEIVDMKKTQLPPFKRLSIDELKRRILANEKIPFDRDNEYTTNSEKMVHGIYPSFTLKQLQATIDDFVLKEIITIESTEEGNFIDIDIKKAEQLDKSKLSANAEKLIKLLIQHQRWYNKVKDEPVLEVELTLQAPDSDLKFSGKKVFHSQRELENFEGRLTKKLDLESAFDASFLTLKGEFGQYLDYDEDLRPFIESVISDLEYKAYKPYTINELIDSLPNIVKFDEEKMEKIYLALEKLTKYTSSNSKTDHLIATPKDKLGNAFSISNSGQRVVRTFNKYLNPESNIQKFTLPFYEFNQANVAYNSLMTFDSYENNLKNSIELFEDGRVNMIKDKFDETLKEEFANVECAIDEDINFMSNDSANKNFEIKTKTEKAQKKIPTNVFTKL